MNPRTNSAAPAWAYSNAKKLLDSLDCSPLMDLLRISYRPGQILDKARLKTDISGHILNYSKRGILLKNGRDSFFIALKSFSAETPGKEEQCLSLCDVRYKIRKTRVDFSFRTIINISDHCIARIFERDVQLSNKIVSSILDPDFLKSLDKFTIEEFSLSEDDLSLSYPFACNFLDGFLAGSVRPMRDYLTEELMPVYDCRTYLNRRDKPQWLSQGSGRRVFHVENEDRRAAVVRERIRSHLKS